MPDTTHLVALYDGLARERQRFAEATSDQEKRLRAVWIEQRKREIEAEMRFLGMSDAPLQDMTADALLAALEDDAAETKLKP